MVQINPDQLFSMMGKLQAELMVLRDVNTALEIKVKQLEAQTQLAQAQAKKGGKKSPTT